MLSFPEPQPHRPRAALSSPRPTPLLPASARSTGPSAPTIAGTASPCKDVFAIESSVISNAEDLDEQVITTWDRLAVESSLPYSTPAWMNAFWQEHHESTGEAELRLVVVRDHSEIVGIGPFYADAVRALGLREWWPLGAGIGQRTGPLAVRGREREVASAIAARVAAEGATMLRLPASDSLTPWGRWLVENWPAKPRPRLCRYAVPALTIAVRGDGDFDAWLGAKSRNFRSQIQRRTRNLARAQATIRRIVDPTEVPEILATLVSLQRARFASMGRESSLTARVERAVTRAAAALLQDGQRARLWVVEAADGVVAAQLHVVAGNRMCYYNGGSSPSWARESLGTVLLATAVRDAHELGLSTIDLGGGDQPYKRRFADGESILEWCSVIPVGLRYPIERGRLLRGDMRRAAVKMVARLPDAQRAQVLALRRSLKRTCRP